jgi:hypothetical protein
MLPPPHKMAYLDDNSCHEALALTRHGRSNSSLRHGAALAVWHVLLAVSGQSDQKLLPHTCPTTVIHPFHLVFSAPPRLGVALHRPDFVKLGSLLARNLGT